MLLRTFVNVTMYPQQNNNKEKENKKIKAITGIDKNS
jgi:hypothetical protein